MASIKFPLVVLILLIVYKIVWYMHYYKYYLVNSYDEEHASLSAEHWMAPDFSSSSNSNRSRRHRHNGPPGLNNQEKTSSLQTQTETEVGKKRVKPIMNKHEQEETQNNNNNNNNKNNMMNTMNMNKRNSSSNSSRSSSIRRNSKNRKYPNRYAYAYLVGGCDPDEPKYRGFLYNILVSTKILREQGSNADVVLFVQLVATTTATKLPVNDTRLLQAYNIRTYYIPPSKEVSFYGLMLDKFRILGLTDYSRVLYMDSDVMPLANLDYFFQLSAEHGILEENMIWTGTLEPANGGFFMLRPNGGDLQDLNEIARYRQETARTMKYPYFDEYHGWGHVITPPDQWETTQRGNVGTNWTFWAAFADQGLLYHWTKYVRKRVSIVLNQNVQNWHGSPVQMQLAAAAAGGGGRENRTTTSATDAAVVSMKEFLEKPFATYLQPIQIMRNANCQYGARPGDCILKKEFYHFTGTKKPWCNPYPPDLSNETKFNSPLHYWLWIFQSINRELEMGLEEKLQPEQRLVEDHHRQSPQTKQTEGVGRFPAQQSVLRGAIQLDSHHESLDIHHHHQNNHAMSAEHHYAYAFVIGGCDPNHPSTYRNFLYNILVSTKILREQGSKADVVLFIQLVASTTTTTTTTRSRRKLPTTDMRLLHAYNIRTFYIPPSKDASFYSLMMDKFRILSLTDYSRVLYMDSDVMPLSNLDYVFELSAEREILEENIIWTNAASPADGGFFMLKPDRGDLEDIHTIIHHRQETAQRMGSPYFDEYHGWGHVITPPDQWQGNQRKNSGTKWTFWAAFADQGLLYHWTKYVQKRVSIVVNDKVQNWHGSPINGTVLMKDVLVEPFTNYSKVIPVMRDIHCKDGPRPQQECIPQKGFFHFQKDQRPWIQPYPVDLTNMTKFDSPLHYWFWILQQINDELNMGLDPNFQANVRLDSSSPDQSPNLGKFPKKESVLKGKIQLDTHYESYEGEEGEGAEEGEEEGAGARDMTTTVTTTGNSRPQNVNSNNNDKNDDDDDDDDDNDNNINNNHHHQIKMTSEELSPASVNAVKGSVTTNAAKINSRRHDGLQRYAYAYLVGGCDPDQPTYRNFLYNILVSTNILRDQGSKADVVVFIQLTATTTATKLPASDIRVLQAYNIRTFYIPPSNETSFYSLMLDKFRILGLTDYARVLYMDSDVMPLTNLDYFFELSAETHVLEENMVWAGTMEPANGGFFMLKPNQTDLVQLNAIARHRQETAKTLKYPYFDEYYGWGHVITPPDQWQTTTKGIVGTNWTFWAAFADQGLLYHWTKYVRKRVSIILPLKVQNWHESPINGTVTLREVLETPFMNYSKPIPVRREVKCRNWTRPEDCNLKKIFFHFTGTKKPWTNPYPSDLTYETQLDSPLYYWFWIFRKVNIELHMGLEGKLRGNQRLDSGVVATSGGGNSSSASDPKKIKCGEVPCQRFGIERNCPIR